MLRVSYFTTLIYKSCGGVWQAGQISTVCFELIYSDVVFFSRLIHFFKGTGYIGQGPGTMKMYMIAWEFGVMSFLSELTDGRSLLP